MSAKTVDTSATSYLPVASFLARVDARTVAQLVSDAGVAVTASALTTDPNLAACLLDASGWLEEAMLRGGRYRPTDLAALTGAGQAGLYRLLTRMTMFLLYERRPDKEMKQPWLIEYVEDQLRRIADGELVFSFLEVEQVGVATSRVETPEDVEARDGTSFICRRMLGRRGNRTRGPQG